MKHDTLFQTKFPVAHLLISIVLHGTNSLYHGASLHIEPHRSIAPVKKINRTSLLCQFARPFAAIARPPCDADTHTRRKKPILPQIMHGNLYALSLPNQPPLAVSHLFTQQAITFLHHPLLLFSFFRLGTRSCKCKSDQRPTNHTSVLCCVITPVFVVGRVRYEEKAKGGVKTRYTTLRTRFRACKSLFTSRKKEAKRKAQA
jgi:hypothetical protein